MRSERAIKNLITSVLQELTAIACGLLLPRLVLSHFGSAYNGVTASIAQFLGCAALLRAGVEVGVLWRDGRQFHIPYGVRMALGLPTGKLEEALYRLKQYVL